MDLLGAHVILASPASPHAVTQMSFCGQMLSFARVPSCLAHTQKFLSWWTLSWSPWVEWNKLRAGWQGTPVVGRAAALRGGLVTTDLFKAPMPFAVAEGCVPFSNTAGRCKDSSFFARHNIPWSVFHVPFHRMGSMEGSGAGWAYAGQPGTVNTACPWLLLSAAGLHL